MATSNVKLPKGKDLARLIDRHVSREEARLCPRYTSWMLAFYYMMGARRFDIYDPTRGRVSPHWVDEHGAMEFQLQDLVSANDRVSGRLASLDLRPKAVRQGMSLEGIRERSIAQVIADNITGDQQLDAVKTSFAYLFTWLGCCGITQHVTDDETVGLTGDFEVIHPRELFPFPSLSTDYTKEIGMVRQRWIPWEMLKDRSKELGGKRLTTEHLQNMDYMYRTIGDIVETEQDLLPGLGGLGATITEPHGRGAAPTDQDKTITVYVKVRELWLYGPRDTCSQYAVSSGEELIFDRIYAPAEAYCTVGFARFMENGTFHGGGLFDLMFSHHRELEKLLKQLYNNIRDIDRYGVLVLPHGAFNQNVLFKDVGHGLRVLFHEPDPVTGGERPFSITPFNSGDAPGKVAAFAREMLNAINPVQDLIAEKGRVDSEVGLRFLDEQINRSLTNPGRGVQRAFGTCYRAACAKAAALLVEAPRPLSIGRLTLDLAGAVVDSQGNTVNFQDNPLPNFNRINFGVKEINPRSEVARKTEALELARLRMEITGSVGDWDGFVLFALDEGLDFAFWVDEYQGAYESVVNNILILYGNGQIPGEIVLTPHISRPQFQLRVLTAFMSDPRMAMASAEVQDKFKQYRQVLMQYNGTLPEGVPNPDEMLPAQMPGGMPGAPPLKLAG